MGSDGTCFSRNGNQTGFTGCNACCRGNRAVHFSVIGKTCIGPLKSDGFLFNLCNHGFRRKIIVIFISFYHIPYRIFSDRFGRGNVFRILPVFLKAVKEGAAVRFSFVNQRLRLSRILKIRLRRGSGNNLRNAFYNLKLNFPVRLFRRQ